MANNMMQMLTDVPPMLIVAWTAWFIAGGMLAMWYRRASLEAEFAPVPAPAPRAVARPRPAARPASEAAPVGSAAFAGDSAPVLAEPPREKRAKQLVVGDPYGDLASLLDQPSQDTPAAPAYRTPSDSPILNSAGSPIKPRD
jgi:hypothetical protein